VFKLNKSGKETVLHIFTGGTDGAYPYASVVRDQTGNLYGTTTFGGDLNCPQFRTGCGVAFKVDLKGTFTVLHTFEGGPDGAAPLASLTLDTNGNLFGTTELGGDTNTCGGLGCGVVFMLDSTGKETVLHTFTGGEDGSEPGGDLFLDKVGNIYGTAELGGAVSSFCTQGCGVVFKLDSKGNFIVLHAFTGTPQSDGANPGGGLVSDKMGNLYGTTGGGGLFTVGTVFKLHGKTETVLYTFKGAPDGAIPNGKLIRDQAGNLYGTTYEGGKLAGRACYGGCGTVFEVMSSGKEKVLHAFDLHAGAALGGRPQAGLTLDAIGNLYGTASNGGDRSCKTNQFIGCGVIFELTP
jgi:uncharacterized repeat protein (TIGR03803 family)